MSYRPGRTQHQALDKLGRTIQQRRVNFIVEADIKGFFDHVNQKWLLQFLGHRIGDPRVLRLIVRMLKRGVMENGLVQVSDERVPQGGNLSSLLSNVYLHYSLDLWFERRFKARCRGVKRKTSAKKYRQKLKEIKDPRSIFMFLTLDERKSNFNNRAMATC